MSHPADHRSETGASSGLTFAPGATLPSGLGSLPVLNASEASGLVPAPGPTSNVAAALGLPDAEPREAEGSGPKGTFAFVSLGCPKNLVDSERMLGLLAADGYVPVSDPRGASMVVVNTCGFIESARAESRQVIHEMVALKERGDVGGVIVTGCLAERLGPQLITEIPKIDHAVGVFGREEITKVAGRFMNGAMEQRTLFRPASVKLLDDTARLRITPRHFAYLKISEGCDRLCTFCAIPKMRGKHITKPIETILAEARELAADGVRELNIVSQDTTYYGMDLYGRVRLAELVRELNRIDGIEWIRFLYAYPEHVSDELIDTFASCEKVVPYLDMPLQHISDPVLKRMQRRVNRAKTVDILGRLRERWPGLALRTTFIVGFPGETDEQFEELSDFVAEAKFERAGVFTYSWEEDTPATRLDGHLPEEVKNARRDRLMEIQQKVAFELAAAKVGTELEVLLDTELPADEEGVIEFVGRTKGDAPEIDTSVYVTGDDLAPGKFVRVNVLDHVEYDLVAEAVSPSR
jgi:ribosomal protein S12 methylthiotransferase